MQEDFRIEGIAILRKILRRSDEIERDARDSQAQESFTFDSFAEKLQTAKIISNSEREVLSTCFDTSSNNQSKEVSSRQRYTSEEIYVKLKAIKRQLEKNGSQEQIDEKSSSQNFQKVQKQRVLDDEILKKNFEANKNKEQEQKAVSKQNQRREADSAWQMKGIGNLSKQSKRDNQIIKRNMKAVKKLAMGIAQEGISVQDHPEYFRVNYELSKKLFDKYRKCPVGVTQQGTQLTFDGKVQYRETLNYHKIMQIFAEGKIKIDVQQKLHVLRNVKKHCFNQQFISLDEWNKIYKVIVHSLHFKESLFEKLISGRHSEKSVPKSKPQSGGNQVISHQSRARAESTNSKFRSRRIKTEAQTAQEYASTPNIDYGLVSQVKTRLKSLSSVTGPQDFVKMEFQSKHTSVHNPHKKILKDISAFGLKNVRKELKLQKVVGVEGFHSQKELDRNRKQAEDCEGSYLKKAMVVGKGVSQITWDSLFSMTAESALYFVKVPEFALSIEEG